MLRERGFFVRFKDALPAQARARCHSITHQEVVAVLKRQGDLEWLPEFQEKYLGKDRKEET
jgi:hypothetical protein